MGPQPLIAPPAVIGILGGGQLGRMLGGAAHAMGYRVAVLDPDTDFQAAAVADRLVIGSYDDVGAALRLAECSTVVTYELEHVAAAVVAAVEAVVPVRPGSLPLLVTQDRLTERRFVGDEQRQRPQADRDHGLDGGHDGRRDVVQFVCDDQWCARPGGGPRQHHSTSR